MRMPQRAAERTRWHCSSAATRADACGWIDSGEPGTKLFALPLALPPRVLLLGAGPDTLPIVDFAARLGWKVTLVDHRAGVCAGGAFPARGTRRACEAR